MKSLTYTLIFLFLMLFAFSCGCKAQNIRQYQVKFLPDSLRNKPTKAEADAKYQTKTAFSDSFQVNFNRTSIDQIKEISQYEPVIADSSILLYSGGVWSIFDLSEALSATANNAINITYPDANTISFNDTDVLLLDPLTLEINGSNQLTVIGGVGGSGGLFETDGNGDLMPNDAEVTDTYYELDGNGDIQPL